jgi:hypothetical protein
VFAIKSPCLLIIHTFERAAINRKKTCVVSLKKFSISFGFLDEFPLAYFLILFLLYLSFSLSPVQHEYFNEFLVFLHPYLMPDTISSASYQSGVWWREKMKEFKKPSKDN